MKPMNCLGMVVAIGSAFLSGCLNLTPPASTAEAHGLTPTAKPSASVQVNGPRLQMNKGKLELAGTIAKKPGAGITAFSHLDILFCDASGRVVQTTPIEFVPGSVDLSRHSERLGYYSLTLEPLLESTARIEVVAHDAAWVCRMPNTVEPRPRQSPSI
jgi:hypothetical protein